MATLQLKAGVDVDPEQYVRQNVNPAMVQVVYEWARGTPFKDICELTEVSVVDCELHK